MNQLEAANLLSVTVRTLSSWHSEDPPIPFKRISQTELDYAAPEIVRWWGAREVRKAIRTSNNWQEEKMVAESREAVAKAELREIELARVKAELLPAGEVERAWTQMLLTFRQALLNMPHQLAVAFEDGLAYAERKAKVQAMIDRALRDLAAEPVPGPAPVPAAAETPAPKPKAPAKQKPVAAKRKSPTPRLKPAARAARVARKPR